ncbi:MAG TPA: hypothetical protein VHT05_15385 [Candidatus Elarobacter sp.]|jgi:uncharacterized membrane protein|nr:hypothetical protein [Candidatus Elarobacter sp.]
MDNYIAVVFDTVDHAADALHALWNLDAGGDITVHGAAVIRRDDLGYIQVATKETHPGMRTAIGVGVGALLGALAGPIGAAAGASIAVGAAAGIGAAAGGVVGLTGDAVKSGEHEQAAYEAGFTMDPGQAAVVAEVSEDYTGLMDATMARLGGIVFRRAKSTVLNDSFTDDYYTDYLYPYDYDPYWA